MIGFFAIFFTLYGALNYYIFIRGWQVLAPYPFLKPYYIILFLLVSLSYLLTRFISEYLSVFFYDSLLWIGSFWFAFMAYFFLSILLIDLIRLFNWKLQFFPAYFKTNYEQVKQVTAVVVIILVTAVIIYGFINTRIIVIRTLDITLPKGAGQLTELNAVLAADLHLSPLNDDKLLTRIIQKINSLNPDIVLMPGDIVDDKAEILKHREVGNAFTNIKTKYGVYASNGNHEFITGVKEAVKFMEEFEISVLQDSSILIDNSFYIVGRDDGSRKNFVGTDRKSLNEIMISVNKDYPTILLDHTPLQLEEAQQNGIALQLSGHTHHGQIFPANLITSMIYEVSWGYLRKGNTQYYVTSGVGTWGPPVRIGSDTEIVNLKIKFK